MTPVWLWATAGAVFVGLMTITLVVLSPVFTSASRRRIQAIELYLGTPAPDRTADDQGGEPGRRRHRAGAGSASGSPAGATAPPKAALLIERADLPLRTSEWYVLRGLAVLVGLMGGWFLLRGAGALVLLGLLLGAVLGLALPPVVLKVLAARRARKFEQQLPDVLTLLASSLATGFSLPQAIDAIVRDAAEPSAKEFSRALAETRIGAELEDSLDRLSPPAGQRQPPVDDHGGPHPASGRRQPRRDAADHGRRPCASGSRSSARCVPCPPRAGSPPTSSSPCRSACSCSCSRPTGTTSRCCGPPRWVAPVGRWRGPLGIGVVWMKSVVKVEV